MVTRIQEARSSARGILEYNENKVALGVATPVHVRNMGFDDTPPELSPLSTIFDVFEDLEQHPALSTKVRKTSLHFTVNPSESDAITEPEVLNYVDEIMSRIGFGSQPYIVYRHNDIERPHYHIVSTTIAPDGTIIPTNFIGYQFLSIQKDLSEKYHFTVGREQQEDIEKEQGNDILYEGGTDYPVLKPESANKTATLKAVVQTAMQFLFRSFEEFRCILASMGVGVTRLTRKDGPAYSFYAIKDGKWRGSRMFGDKKYGREVYLEAEKKIEQRIPGADVQQRDRNIRQIQTASDYVARISGSPEEYAAKMGSIGLPVEILREAQTKRIERVVIVSRRMRTAADSLEGEVDIVPMLANEETGAWVRRGRGRPAKGKANPDYAKLTDEQMGALKKAIREPGTGKTTQAPTQQKQQKHKGGEKPKPVMPRIK